MRSSDFSGLSFSALFAIFPVFSQAGFFRVNCGAIQHGRIDPILSPGIVGDHVHKVSGGYNFALDSTYEDLRNSKCTSCEITADKSAYWTPMLYYQHPNGTFSDVPSGGHLVYYLGRGKNITGLQPFPPGFRMVSGDSRLRAYNKDQKTWNGKRPIADRVSFACLDKSGHRPETHMLDRTQCSSGLRAQIQFQSCWDGHNVYKDDNSHVAYMSDIDNGECPSTHPIPLVHLFFEVYYMVDKVDQQPGGRFVFSTGDTTGYGFHGDFFNGWDPDVLKAGIKDCVIGDNPSGQISKCKVLAAVDSPHYGKNCPERKPQVNERVLGLLDQLPGCNPPTSGPSPSEPKCKPSPVPGLNKYKKSTLADIPSMPKVNAVSNGWQFLGSVTEPKGGGRALDGPKTSGDDMSVSGCQNFCASKNYKLAGVEYGRECFCGNDLKGNARVDSSGDKDLNFMTCAGSENEYCGGPSKLLVYKSAR